MPDIMVVEDDVTNRETLVMILQGEGFRVIEAGSGDVALTILENQNVDLVLSDVRMPGSIDGIALLQEIKKRDKFVEVILITAYGSVELAVNAMKAGAYDFIVKPFKKIDIMKAVKNALEKRMLSERVSILKQELAQNKKTSTVVDTDFIKIPAAKGLTLDDMENIIIKEFLIKNDWNKAKAAKALGINPRTIFRKIEAGEIEDKD